jgi:hypothetical protein
MLSQKAKYALRALMVLADRKTGDPMQLREIATAEKDEILLAADRHLISNRMASLSASSSGADQHSKLVNSQAHKV